MVGALAFATPAGAATHAELRQAKAYVEGIYRTIPGRFDYASIHYAPELKNLVDRDGAWSRASGDVGVVDGIAFCDCQDTAPNYRIITSSVAARGATGAVVTVMLRNEKTARFTIDLSLSRGHWLVADIHSPETPSFLGLLRREVPREEAELRESRGSQQRHP
ncbi:MAG: hypothetical protein ABI810_19725 [Sphingomonas bacterium]